MVTHRDKELVAEGVVAELVRVTCSIMEEATFLETVTPLTGLPVQLALCISCTESPAENPYPDRVTVVAVLYRIRVGEDGVTWAGPVPVKLPEETGTQVTGGDRMGVKGKKQHAANQSTEWHCWCCS